MTKHDDLLRFVSEENHGAIRDGLKYTPELRRLAYRLYCPIPSDMSGFDNEELTFCERSSAPL